jgi:NADPH:quinone reductase-like Zn-dependent oxidoreductase
MNAVQIQGYGGPEMLHYEEVARPTHGEGEVLIRVHAAGVNPLDWKVRSGHAQLPIEWRVRAGYAPLRSSPTFPIIPGFDVAGVIEVISADVRDFELGDEVYASPKIGGYAEYVAVAAHDVAHKPQTLDFIQAAAMPVAAVTAWQALFDSMQLKPGQTLLIHGAAGGIGTFAVQLAKWQGAHVIGTASAHNLEYLRQLGADETIDYTTTRFEKVVREVDAVLDVVGGETRQRSRGVLKPDGVLVTIRGSILPTILPTIDEAEQANWYLAGMIRPIAGPLAELARLVDAGYLMPYVSVILPLHEARQAHVLSESRHVRGKIVLQVRT